MMCESFVRQRILDDLEGKIDNHQYGALRGRSTTHELIDILHHRYQAIDSNSSVFTDYTPWRSITQIIRLLSVN